MGNTAKSVLIAVMVYAIALTAMPYSQATPMDKNEASEFFTEIIEHTDNPIIAALAKESLLKLRGERTMGTSNLAISENVATNKVVSLQKAAEMKPSKDPNAVEIPLVKGSYSSNLVVPALLNRGVNGTFIVDTGATYSVITPQLAKALGVQINSKTQRIPILTANGWIQAPIVSLDHMSIGNVEVSNIQAVVQDLGGDPQLSGLLGMNFFKDIELTIRRDKLILRISSNY